MIADPALCRDPQEQCAVAQSRPTHVARRMASVIRPATGPCVALRLSARARACFPTHAPVSPARCPRHLLSLSRLARPGDTGSLSGRSIDSPVFSARPRDSNLDRCGLVIN